MITRTFVFVIVFRPTNRVSALYRVPLVYIQHDVLQMFKTTKKRYETYLSCTILPENKNIKVEEINILLIQL
jgi:hypothetical protein